MPPLTVYVGFEPDLPALGAMGSTGAISGLANFLPRTVHRMVLEPQSAATTEDASRVDASSEVLKPYALIPALKSVMATLQDEPGWLRVRPPLVALTPSAHAELAAQLQRLQLGTDFPTHP